MNWLGDICAKGEYDDVTIL